ncbi:MAG: HD domain-containing protein [Gemmatimonadales bacterium]|jgi:putative nucleotidyltransferase with HDIG domain
MNEVGQVAMPAARRDEEGQERPEAGHVLRTMAALRSACVLYPEGHPAIDTQVEEVLRHARTLLRGQSLVRLDIIRGILHCNGSPLQRESRIHARALREMTAIGIDSIHLAAGLEPAELRVVGSYLAHEHRGPGTGDPVVETLQSRGVRHVSLGRVLPIKHRVRARPPEAPDALHDEGYRATADAARNAFDSLEQGYAPDVRAIHDMLEVLVGRVARSSVALHQVMALKDYENRSYLHSVNVALLAVRLGERLGMDQRELMVLAEAALLHDVGKTQIPVDILTKTGRPTEREWRTIRRHPLIGAEILNELEGLTPLTPVAALEHHVEFGGGGYPHLGGDRRPHAISQIVSVVDVYESVTGARTYRDPATPDQACLILARMAGEKLNPALVKAFVSVVTFFPVGTLVRTTRDELGVVVRTHDDDALHPTIVLVDPSAPDAGPGRTCDLRTRLADGRFERDVVESVPPATYGIDVPGILRQTESS